MIVFLGLIGLFALLIVAEILLGKYCDKHPPIFKKEEEMTKEELKQHKRTDRAEGLILFNILPLIILFVIIGVSSVFVIRDNLPAYRDEILKEKSLIIYKIENGEYDSNSEMISAVDDFNEKVEDARKGLDNPWVSWYHSRHYRDINPIEYEINVDGVTYKN